MQQVRLYIDESYTEKNELGDSWLYICTVAVRERDHTQVLDGLIEDRTLAQCYSEIHFNKAKAARKVDLAHRWIRRVHHATTIYFHILGVHLNRLENGFFGGPGAERDERIYTRFFRPAITWPLRAFFGSSVEVTAVFHDRGTLEHHDWFDWHALWRIGKDHPDLVFKTDRVMFIDSDHRVEEVFPNDSHFIQLADLILGTTRVCLDGGCKNEQKRSLALANFELVKRMMSGVRNKNSSYNYVDRKTISFFPSKTLTVAATQEDRLRSGFFHSRDMLIATDQLSLFSA